jgi:hypothetical protein
MLTSLCVSLTDDKAPSFLQQVYYSSLIHDVLCWVRAEDI